jgi:hypothetical protein
VVWFCSYFIEVNSLAEAHLRDFKDKIDLLKGKAD